MAVVPVVFSNTAQDYKVLFTMCDLAMGLFGAEKSGSFSITTRFSESSVNISVITAPTYRSSREKVIDFTINDGSSKLFNFFEKAGAYWRSREGKPNVILMNILYEKDESGRLVRSFQKLDFFHFNVNKFESHKDVVIVPLNTVIGK